MRKWPLLLTVTAAALLWLAPALARADGVVFNLGVRSLDGNDELARDVSRALAEGTRRVAGFRVSNREVTLSQMTLALGCEESSEVCLSEIARTLSADRLVFGSMVREADGFALTLVNFDGREARIEHIVRELLDERELQSAALGPLMIRLAQRLAGPEQVASVRVTGLPVGAQILLDGHAVGNLDEQGELQLTSVPIGAHRVELRHGEQLITKDIHLVANEHLYVPLGLLEQEPAPTVASDEPAPNDDVVKRRKIVGYSLIGLSGTLALSALYTWQRLEVVRGDPDLRDYRNLFPAPSEPGGTNNVCREAQRRTLESRQDPTSSDYDAIVDLEGSTRGLCKQTQRLEVTQLLLVGTGLLAGVIGLYILFADPPASREPATKANATARSLRIEPSVSPQRASVQATLRF